MRRATIAALIGAAALVGCGGTSSVGGDQKTTDTASSDAAPGQASPATLKEFAAYTGSELGAADPSLAPVKLGFINQEGGAFSYPQFTTQADAMVKTINDELGGIGGHPLQLVKCYVVSAEEEGQSCGQKFANDDQIKAVLQFALSNGQGPFHSAVAARKIPVIGGLAVSTVDALSPDSYYTAAGIMGTIPGYVKFAKEYLHAKTVALVNVAGEPTSTSVARLMKQGFELAGMKVQQSSFSIAQTDVTGPLAAAGATKADVIVPLVLTPPQCLGMANTLKRLNVADTPVLALYGCLTSTLKQGFGDYPKWIYGADTDSVLVPSQDPQVEAQLKASNDWFAPLAAAGDDTQPIVTLQVMLTAVRALNQAGGAAATRAQLSTAAKAFTGPMWIGIPTVAYGAIQMLPALPGLGMRFFQYDGDDQWTDATDGNWIVGELGGG